MIIDYVITLIITFVIIGVVVIVLSRVRTPRYRLRRENVITLLKMVLAGKASENDWNVFVSMPIRYDPELEKARARCVEIEEREFLGGSGARSGKRPLFTKKGIQELQEILSELQASSDE